MIFSRYSSFWLYCCCCFFLSTSVTRVAALHREDDSKYFLFIEPDASHKATAPVDDELTASLQAAWEERIAGTSRYTDMTCSGKFTPDNSYKGMHFAEDGEISDTVDYRLPNGFITNSLCLHYVRYYREHLPTSELRKLQALHEFMQQQRESSQNQHNEEKQHVDVEEEEDTEAATTSATTSSGSKRNTDAKDTSDKTAPKPKKMHPRRVPFWKKWFMTRRSEL